MATIAVFAARTPRSQAYLGAFVRAGLTPDLVIIAGSVPEHDVGKAPVTPRQVFSESLDETCARMGWKHTHCQADAVNTAEVEECLRSLAPDFLIYSGFGAQIVRQPILDTCEQIVHIHSGWLPEYRGSTTLYYSWLNENRVGVSAILLDREIDHGKILIRKHFPSPPSGVDVDYRYDAEIRADVLHEILVSVRDQGRLPEMQSQCGDATDYFVIHPVLKHIALLKNG